MVPDPLGWSPLPADIAGVTASTWAPVFYLLRANNLSDEVTTLHSLNPTFQENNEGKFRPCLIMDHDDEGYTICLFATFEGRDPRTLPRILRHFVIPVSSISDTGVQRSTAPAANSSTFSAPNADVPSITNPPTANLSVQPFKLITNPPWETSNGKDQWIIACPFPTPSRLSRWNVKRAGKPYNGAVDPAIFIGFQEVLQRLEADIVRILQDEDERKSLMAELNVCPIVFQISTLLDELSARHM